MSIGTDVVMVVDADTMRVVMANRAFSRILGYTSDEIAGLTAYDLVASDRDTADANIGRLALSGTRRRRVP